MAARSALCVFVFSAWAWLGPACTFFEEIPLGSEETTSESDANESESGSDTASDDECGPSQCLSQDTMRTCIGDPPTSTELDCASLCQGQVNISCVRLGTNESACWCVVPNEHDVTSCSDLEGCLQRCGTEVAKECGLQCFSLANAATGRLYGALVTCAQTSCNAFCTTNPDSCATCISNAVTGNSGPCALQRAACDNDWADGER